VFFCEVVTTLCKRKKKRVEECVDQVIVDRNLLFAVACHVHYDMLLGVEVVVCQIEHCCYVCTSWAGERRAWV
jgi:hypothetical protein